MDFLPIPKNFSTLSIRSSKHTEDNDYVSVVPPLVSSVNFKVNTLSPDPRGSQKYIYAVESNPSRSNLEHCLAVLDGGKYGVSFASGAGSLSSLLAILKPGSHIICSDSIFGGSFVLLSEVANTFSFTTSFVNIYDLQALKNAIQPSTSLIWIEPVSNPLLKVADIKSIAKIARERNVLLAVDNTFLTPYCHRPLDMGVDVVSYSVTKYINGHDDVVMGSLIMNKKELYDKLRSVQKNMGIIPSPSDCIQVMRSLKTLPLRMKQHSLNATKVAQYLENHSKIIKVIHPGLPSHPQHKLFKSQSSGHSGVISFYIKADLQQTKQFLNNFKLIIPTASLGSTDSLAEIPLIMSHSIIPEEHRDPNVTANLVRLSVGLEDDEDIIKDLQQALDKL